MFCCGTTRINVGPPRWVERSGEWKLSKQIFHWRGTAVFWHWEDQIGRLRLDTLEAR